MSIEQKAKLEDILTDSTAHSAVMADARKQAQEPEAEQFAEGLESAVGEAETGVPNVENKKLPRTRGQKVFDLALYPLIANIGVWALSVFVTYHSSFNKNIHNPFVKRSKWFKEEVLGKRFGMDTKQAQNLNMVVWSFIDGSLMAPLVAWFEAHRKEISQWIDKKSGTVPEDDSVYDQETKRGWKHVLGARAATFAMVISTYYLLNHKIKSIADKGITGIKGETVNSVNGLVFDVPARHIGETVQKKFPKIMDWATNLSQKQMQKLTPPQTAKIRDGLDQIEGLANTGLFEIFYTSLCTLGLWAGGLTFAKLFTKKKDDKDKGTMMPDNNSQGIDKIDPINFQEKASLMQTAIPRVMPKVSREDQIRNLAAARKNNPVESPPEEFAIRVSQEKLNPTYINKSA